MGKQVTISEFSIKVRLDTGSAARGLSRLETKLKTFQDYVNKSFKNTGKQKVIIAQTAVVLDKVNRKVDQQKKKWSGVNKEIRKAKKGASGLKKLLVAGAAFVSVRSLFHFLKDTISTISKYGMQGERAFISLNAAIAGSSVAAKKSSAELAKLQRSQVNFINTITGQMGLDPATAAADYAKFFAASSGYIGVGGSQKLFQSLSELGVVYGLSEDQMMRSSRALTQMASKNQIMAEELKLQLGDNIPAALEIFARAVTKSGKFGDVTVKKLYKLMDAGKLVASEILPFVAEEFSRLANAGGALDEALSTPARKFDILKTRMKSFSLGVYNQFKDTFGKVLTTLTELFNMKSVQVRLGAWIDSALRGFQWFVDKVLEVLRPFEEDFLSAKTLEEKRKVIASWGEKVNESLKKAFDISKDTPWMEVLGAKLSDALIFALNAISSDDLTKFSQTIADVVSDAGKDLVEGIGNANRTIATEMFESLAITGTKDRNWSLSPTQKVWAGAFTNLSEFFGGPEAPLGDTLHWLNTMGSGSPSKPEITVNATVLVDGTEIPSTTSFDTDTISQSVVNRP